MGRGHLAGEGVDPVSEDEAFIHAIVASPGDDLPRLVYADYLDERGDRRGPYLRGEIEWAAPWRDGKVPSGVYEMLGWSVGLDPLWVARVSRPPVGVCCDHLTFTDSGRALTVADIDRAAEQLGVELPVQHQAFLLNHNGGVPSKTRFISSIVLPALEQVEGLRDPLSYSDVGHFLGIARSFVDDLVDAALSLRPRGLSTELVPVAVIPDSESLVLISASRDGGRVYLWGDVEGEPYDPDALDLRSDTLADFLADLTDRPQ